MGTKQSLDNIRIPDIEPEARVLVYRGVDPLTDLRWYAIYCRPRHEKRVCDELLKKGFEAYLPLVKECHQWSDRKKWVEVPLIRGYVFVHITLRQSTYILEVPSALQFVTFNKHYEPIPDFQIEALQRTVDSGYSLKISEYLKVGELVEVTDGSLKGVVGRVQRVENEDKFVITLDAIQTAFQVTINAAYLQPISSDKKKRLVLPLGLEQ